MQSKASGLVLIFVGFILMVYAGYHDVDTEAINNFETISNSLENRLFMPWISMIGVVLLISGWIMLDPEHPEQLGVAGRLVSDVLRSRNVRGTPLCRMSKPWSGAIATA